MGPDSKPAPPAEAHSLHPVLEPRNRPALTEPKRAHLVLLDLVAPVEENIVSNADDTSAVGGWPFTKGEILEFDSSATGIHLRAATGHGFAKQGVDVHSRAINRGKPALASVEGEEEIGAGHHARLRPLPRAQLSPDGEDQLALLIARLTRSGHGDICVM